MKNTNIQEAKTNYQKKNKEIIKLFANLTYIDIERNKIKKKLELLHALDWVKFTHLKDVNYWVEKDLKSLQRTFEYINELI